MEPTQQPNTADTDSRDEPLNIGFLPDEFGIVFPDETGLAIRKQSGMSCRQLQVNGWFLPLKRPHINRGYPDWFPNTDSSLAPNDQHPITGYDLETIPERDYRTLPEWVKARSPTKFYNFEEFSYWLDSVWFYGRCDLIEEVRKWNYDPTGSLTNRTMTDAWDSLDDIWEAIHSELPFNFEIFDYFQKQIDSVGTDTDINYPLDPEIHQTPTEGVKWITITGSTLHNGRNAICPWAEQLKGETVILLYPNCD